MKHTSLDKVFSLLFERDKKVNGDFEKAPMPFEEQEKKWSRYIDGLEHIGIERKIFGVFELAYVC